jgi:cysteine desulfurase / selenocysteine lyase
MQNKGFKEDFSVFEHEACLIYLDSAASTLRPKIVSDSMHFFTSFQHANIHRGAYKLSYEATSQYEYVRQKVKKFIHAATPEEIIFTYGATDSINLLFHSLLDHIPQEGKRKVVLSIFEHHSNLVPWQHYGEKQSMALEYMYDFTPESLEVIDDSTFLVAITLMSNATGFIPPIQKIIEKAHKHGAIVICDGAQLVGHEIVDVGQLDMDFLVFSGHKMFGPTGVGILYGKKKWLEQLKPYRYGGDMIEYVTEQTTTFASLPNRFEAGTPNIEGVIGLGAAIDYIEAIGMNTISEYLSELRSYCLEQLNKLPHIRVVEFNEFGQPLQHVKDDEHPSISGPVIAFTVDEVHPHDVSSILDTSNIAIRAGHHCAQPLMKHLDVQSTCRVSLQIYNTREDIDFFIEKLADVRRWLGYGA